MPTVLIIDDDAELFSLLGAYLETEGFACVHAADAATGLREAAQGGHDALILDVMLPGMNGFDVLRRLRAQEATALVPVLMLTARGEEIDRVAGLETGADDYLAKPFSARELAARLRALLRRASRDATHSPVRLMDDLIIDRASLRVGVNGRQQTLTVPELRLLTLLTRHAGEIVSRDALCTSIFGRPAYPMDRSLDMLVSRLRKKLGSRKDGGERIKSVRGEGYVYLLAGEPS
jgi:two-component system response regulator CpxR